MPLNIPRRLGLRKPTKPQVDWTQSINRGLVACWPITPNAAGGPAILDIAGQRHLTTSSGAISDAKFGGTTIKYDGSTKFSSAPAAKDRITNLGAFSISAWVNHFSAQSGRILLLGGSTATGGFAFTAALNDNIIFLVPFSTTILNRTTNNSTLSENVWHHVVATWPGGLTAANAHVYIDTVEPGYQTTTDGVGSRPDDSGQTLFMGAATATPTNVFNGAVDNVRIWNRVISTTEIKRLYREPWIGIKDRSENIIYHVKSAGGNVTVALTGNASTAAQGTLGVQHVNALTGNSSTASEGNVKAAQPLHGNQATASEGTLGVKLTVALTGNTSTAAQGTIKAVPTKALTGNQIAGSQGTLGVTHANPLSGNQITAFEGTLTPSTSGNVTVALTGNQMTALQGNLTAVAPRPVNLGGHFLPLTRKQLQALQKRQRKERKEQEAAWQQQQQDEAAISAEIRGQLLPSKTIGEVINEANAEILTPAFEDDDEDDLMALLLA